MVVLTRKDGSSYRKEEYPSMHEAIQHSGDNTFSIVNAKAKPTLSDFDFLQAHGLTEEEIKVILGTSKEELVC
jgi:hypothetical protein